MTQVAIIQNQDYHVPEVALDMVETHTPEDMARACAASGALELLESLLPEAAKNVENASCDLTHKFKSLATSAASQGEIVQALVDAIGTIEIKGKKITLQEFIGLFGGTLDDAIGKLLFVSKKAIEMVYGMEDSLKSLEEITNITHEILNINKQTRFLAMNAKIEAARAGDAGKGFSVVADEVKEVSNRIAELSDFMNARTTAIMKSVSGNYAILKEVATMDMNANLEAKETLHALMDGLTKQNDKTMQVMQQSADASRTIAQTIQGMVVNLQFQDRNTQLMENAVRIVNQCLVLFDFCRGNARDSSLIQRMADSIASVITLGEIRSRYMMKMRQDNFLPEVVASNSCAAGETDSIELF